MCDVGSWGDRSACVVGWCCEIVGPSSTGARVSGGRFYERGVERKKVKTKAGKKRKPRFRNDGTIGVNVRERIFSQSAEKTLFNFRNPKRVLMTHASGLGKSIIAEGHLM